MYTTNACPRQVLRLTQKALSKASGSGKLTRLMPGGYTDGNNNHLDDSEEVI